MSYEEWIELGMKEGWCGPPVCSTHDGVPMTENEEVDFDEAIQNTDLIITGEGLLDDTSFDGKVVGSVCDYAREAKTSVAAIVGDIDDAMDSSLYADLRVTNLTQKFGTEESMTHVLRCIEEAAREMLQKS
jgi:glycerate kinase